MAIFNSYVKLPEGKCLLFKKCDVPLPNSDRKSFWKRGPLKTGALLLKSPVNVWVESLPCSFGSLFIGMTSILREAHDGLVPNIGVIWGPSWHFARLQDTHLMILGYPCPFFPVSYTPFETPNRHFPCGFSVAGHWRYSLGWSSGRGDRCILEPR